MGDQINFDSADVKGGGPPLIPEGWHPFIISQAGLKQTKSGDGSYLLVICTVTEPSEHAGKAVFARYNWVNPNPVAVEIGQQQFKDLCTAINRPKVGNTDEILNLEFQGEVKVDPPVPGSGYDRPSVEIKAYLPPGAPIPAEMMPPNPNAAPPAPAAAVPDSPATKAQKAAIAKATAKDAVQQPAPTPQAETSGDQNVPGWLGNQMQPATEQEQAAIAAQNKDPNAVFEDGGEDIPFGEAMLPEESAVIAEVNAESAKSVTPEQREAWNKESDERISKQLGIPPSMTPATPEQQAQAAEAAAQHGKTLDAQAARRQKAQASQQAPQPERAVSSTELDAQAKAAQPDPQQKGKPDWLTDAQAAAAETKAKEAGAAAGVEEKYEDPDGDIPFGPQE